METNPLTGARMAILGLITVEIISLALYLVATRRGLGMSADSANYISAARNWAAGNGLTAYNDTSLTVFPPGLSMVLVIGSKLGFGAVRTIQIVHALVLMTTLLLTWILLRRHLSDQRLVFVLTLFVGMSAPFSRVHRFLLADGIFLLLLVGALLALERVLDDPDRQRWAVLAGVLTSAAYSFRYMGLILVAVAGVTVLSTIKRNFELEDWRRLARTSIAFLVPALIAPAIITIRNFRVERSITGSRLPSSITFETVYERTVTTLSSWIVPVSSSDRAKTLLAFVAVAVITVSVLERWRMRGSKPEGQVRASPVPVAATIVLYLAFLTYSELTTRIDPPDNRLLSPLLIPSVVLVGRSLDVLLRELRNRAGGRSFATAAIVGHVICGLLLVGVIQVHARRTHDGAHRFNAGQARSFPKEPASLRELLDGLNLEGKPIFSNAPDRLFVTEVLDPVFWSPLHHDVVRFNTDRSNAAFGRGGTCEDVHLIWYEGVGRRFLRSLGEIEENVTLELRAQNDAGRVYEVTAC